MFLKRKFVSIRLINFLRLNLPFSIYSFFQANASLMTRHRRESIWIFHPELMKICVTSRACPFRVEPGKPGPVGIFRIERHIFRAAVTPVEKKIAFRVITSKNAILRGPTSPSGDGPFGRNQYGDNRQNRRGYRGRSSRPLTEILAECRTLAEAQQVMQQAGVPDAPPTVGEQVDDNVDDHGSIENDILDLFADEQLADVSVHGADADVGDNESGADAELEGLLAEAGGHAVSYCDYNISREVNIYRYPMMRMSHPLIHNLWTITYG